MTIIYPNIIFKTFFQKLNPYYIIVGNIELFIEEIEKIILCLANKNGFNKSSIIKINYNSNFKQILFIMKTQDIFHKKKIICIFFNKKISILKIKKKLLLFYNHIHNDLLLIIYINWNKIDISNFKFITNFKKKVTIILCDNITDKNLLIWITDITKQINLPLLTKTKKLLIQYYQGNILHIKNMLNILSLLHCDKSVSDILINSIVNNVTLFTPKQWIDSLLHKNLLLAIKILNQFNHQNYNPIILFRHLQNELLTILLIIRENFQNPHIILKKRNITKNRYCLLINFAKHTNYNKLYKSIKLLETLEINIKQNKIKSVWCQLQTLSKIICS